jgi:RNA ligase
VKSGFTDWGRYGDVVVRQKDDLLIFNYTTLAQYAERWNFFERVSRGLIINRQTGEIVARPFDKFFNWGEGGRTSTAPIVTITEKMDGSLGVLYRHQRQYHISTRGTLDSKQGVWATDFLRAHYDLSDLADDLTLLFEIIYPENRIVVDYGARQDLVLIGVRNRFTGDYLSFPQVQALGIQYGFSLPKIYQFEDITTLIANTQALGSSEEGYVVEFADGQRFKFKSLRYLELQRLLVSLTFKNVLKAVQSGTIDSILDMIPDEFLHETRKWITEIQATIQRVKHEVQTAFDNAPKTSRKDFAVWVTTNHLPLSRYLFALLDGKDIEPLIYQHYAWGHEDE